MLPSRSADQRFLVVLDIKGGYSILPMEPSQMAGGVDRFHWVNDRELRVEGSNGIHSEFHWIAGSWRLKASKPTRFFDGLRIEQSLNDPPKLTWADAKAEHRSILFDPNPSLLKQYRLGKIVRFDWPDDVGNVWYGNLIYPAHYQAGHTYPLVIQSSTLPDYEQFSLYGPGYAALGPGDSVFAGQVLSGKGMFVLTVAPLRGNKAYLTPAEPDLVMRGFEGAVRQLSGRKLVDPERVGLSGLSRDGWYVEYALTHSELIFAAAIATDNSDASYIQGAMSGWPYEPVMNMIGAPAFGAGLARWLESSPGFNLDRVRTPLRLQRESGGLAAIGASWETYSRLQALDLPVELAIVPDVVHGSHGLQNPTQLLFSQNGAVEWYEFWLNGHLPAEDAIAHQWRKWRDKLAELANAPRPPLRSWTSEAKSRMDESERPRRRKKNRRRISLSAHLRWIGFINSKPPAH
jgi:hypothetical protein